MKNKHTNSKKTPTEWMYLISFTVITIVTSILSSGVFASSNSDTPQMYLLSSGDEIKINVFQNPDLYLETSITAEGVFNFPLIGQVRALGKSIPDVEKIIEKSLKNGNFIKNPNVSITLGEIKGSSVIVLGQVTTPGVYPIKNNRISIVEAIAMAGGINDSGSDNVRISGFRGGVREEEIFEISQNIPASPMFRYLRSGDRIFVPRSDNFYIYGQAQKPGVYKIEKGMTLLQAVAASGGITDKGTLRGVTITRKNSSGETETNKADLNSEIKTNDVIYIDESIF
ncbi:polysaccharide export protein EpsE [Polynucleobacter paneuropaeus]|jgi:polysaccharide export outer membrane protein|nr:polysaccharide export protein EpsE [Polynucleobacter paneuropaeus]MBT8612029.1 polysaccharide export protein EpsE [Polynucleobacter paneuropaeus]